MVEELQALFTPSVLKSSYDQLLTPKSTWLVFPQYSNFFLSSGFFPEEATVQHAYRTYHQVQKWLGVDKNPTIWERTSNQQGFFSVTYVKDPAPQTLLQFISCKCRK
ncbi:hypothetical protein EVAR_50630_1 [Eumeta japonica]|uniref:Uncharacterized protein n=1 Tax=Eumeta variegata TaxID=151549 RepID=A0A4C1XFT6_EUMVA|nr:hypothetical protein EVAR_50630_1 [Eumeta japonica]